jgi:hypothetical protein
MHTFGLGRRGSPRDSEDSVGKESGIAAVWLTAAIRLKTVRIGKVRQTLTTRPADSDNDEPPTGLAPAVFPFLGIPVEPGL